MIEYVQTSGHSLRIFNDADESFYLRAAVDQANYRRIAAVYFENSETLSLLDLLTGWRPDHTYSHFAAGLLGRLLNLGVLELSLLLDFFAAGGCYLLLSMLFAKITTSKNHPLSEIGAIVFLAFPWLANLENFLTIHPLFSENSIVLDFVWNAGLPILESVETQFSLLLFCGCLLVLLNSVDRGDLGNKSAAVLGALSGALLYLYVLSWLAAAVLLATILFLSVLLIENKLDNWFDKFKRAIILCSCFAATNFLVALPGFIQIHFVKLKNYIMVDSVETYRKAFYGPVEWLVLLLLLLLLFVLFRKRISRPTRTGLVVLISIIIAEYLLLNVQPLTGVATVGVFIVGIYTRPLFSATLLVLAANYYCPRQEFNKIFQILLGVLFVLTLVSRVTEFNNSNSADNEMVELIHYVDRHLGRNSVLAMLTFEQPFSGNNHEWDARWEPNGVAAITNNYLLKESWGLEWGALSAQENISRELALGAVFTGQPQLVRPCIDAVEVPNRMMYFQQWVATQLVRKYSCDNTTELRNSLTSCDVFRSYRIDYVIWESRFLLDQPAYLGYAANLIWKSAKGGLSIYQIDRKKAVEFHC